MIRNIVFDMGQVLMQWNPILPCLRYAKDREKARILCENIFTHPEWGPVIDGGLMTEEEYFVHCSQRMPTQELRQLCMEMSKDWFMDSLYPTSGMQRVVEELLAKGYRLYILSNCGRHFYDFEYRIPCRERFTGVLISAEEKLLKPDEAIYRLLCQRFDLKPEECFFIDDMPQNIQGAKAVGMQGHCFADGDLTRLQTALKNL